jgi:UDP-glucuronate 4-epimerase
MKILVTGFAGFISSALTLRLLERGYIFVGIDNHNYYFDPAIKDVRLARHVMSVTPTILTREST